jgi:hypothetical protein
MDPLSVTASIIAVLQLSAKVLAYLNDVKDASRSRSRIFTAFLSTWDGRKVTSDIYAIVGSTNLISTWTQVVWSFMHFVVWPTSGIADEGTVQALVDYSPPTPFVSWSEEHTIQTNAWLPRML